MLPAVVIVGRPNVGKSTLFNQLTRSRDALVADYPGLTRDRRYGYGRHDGRLFVVVDTGGIGAAEEPVAVLAARQTELALDEADAVVFVVDFKQGLTAADERIADDLRRSGKPVILAVNKAEGTAAEEAVAEFHALGLGEPIAVSALHGSGLDRLLERVLAPFPDEDAPAPEPLDAGPKVAVIGRPNVGKSTLINRLLGAERLITSPHPGTTRDSILVPCERDGRRFVLIDTAGIRRRSRVSEAIEKYSIVQSLRAIEDCGVAIVLLDAQEGVTEQDLHLIGMVVERGRALSIGVNKWDGLPAEQRYAVEAQIERKLKFVSYADVHFISALHGSGISELLASALEAHEAAGRDLPTPVLNDLLSRAVQSNPPPVIRGRRVRLRYAHQGGRRPPLIVVHGSQVQRLPEHYRRYLSNVFREAFRLRGTPLRVDFRSGENPYAGKRERSKPRRSQRARSTARRR